MSRPWTVGGRTRAGARGAGLGGRARGWRPREPAREAGGWAFPGVPGRGGGGSLIPRFPAIASVRPGAPGPDMPTARGQPGIPGSGVEERLPRSPTSSRPRDWGRGVTISAPFAHPPRSIRLSRFPLMIASLLQLSRSLAVVVNVYLC